MPARRRRTVLLVAAGLLMARTAAPDASPLSGDESRLSPTESRIVAWVEGHAGEAIPLLERVVEIPSATTDLTGVRRVGEVFAEELAALGFATRWVELPPEVGRAGHLVAVREGKRGKRVLLIGHLDTVLPGGRFERRGKRALGIGTSDMKGGNVILLYALKALDAVGALEDRAVTVVLTGDEEEAGRPLEVSRAALLAAAAESDVALAFEGAVPGAATIARRGIASWRLTASGRTGHSSAIFDELGYGAIFEAARILDLFRRELAGEEHVSFNPSVIVGGSSVAYDPPGDRGSAEGRTNVVPDEAIVEGDLRFLTVEQRDRVQERMREIATSDHLPGTSAEIVFEEGYPPMAPTPGNRRLLAVLDQVSRDLGYGPVAARDPGEQGAADVSFVAPRVEAALDGLGAMGERAHAPDEQMDLASLPMLIARAAVLIHRLGGTNRGNPGAPGT